MSEPIITPRFDVKQHIPDIINNWLSEDEDGVICPYCDDLLIPEWHEECAMCEDLEDCPGAYECKHQKPFELVRIGEFGFCAHAACIAALTDERRNELHRMVPCYTMTRSNGYTHVYRWFCEITQILRELDGSIDEQKALGKGLLLQMCEVPEACFRAMPEWDGEFDW